MINLKVELQNSSYDYTLFVPNIFSTTNFTNYHKFGVMDINDVVF